MNIKTLIRKTLIFCRIDLTKNLKYDRLTTLILKKVLTKNATTVDVGAHKGEIVDIALKYSQTGGGNRF